LLSLISYFGHMENARQRYLGVKIPPTNLKSGTSSAVQVVRTRAADGLGTGHTTPE